MQETQKIIDDIVSISKDIVAKHEKYRTQVAMKNGSILKKVKTKLSINQVVDIYDNFDHDAQMVLAQHEQFRKYLLTDNADMAEYKCPFLFEVWHGDVYDVAENDSLEKLYQELNDSEFNKATTFEKIVELLNKKCN